jgi:hypothetical protein
MLNGRSATDVTPYVVINSIAFKSCNINKLKTTLFMCPDGARYGVGELLIDDCVIRQSIVRLIRANGSNSAVFKALTMQNSTIWNEMDGTSGYPIQLQGGSSSGKLGLDDWTGTSNVLTLNQCTFYQMSETDQFANFNGTFVSTGDKIEVRKSIFVDCGNGRVIHRLTKNGAAIANLTADQNTYWFAGAVSTDDVTYDAATSIQSDPAFADADNGNFTVGGAAQKAAKTGDPRWNK